MSMRKVADGLVHFAERFALEMERIDIETNRIDGGKVWLVSAEARRSSSNIAQRRSAARPQRADQLRRGLSTN